MMEQLGFRDAYFDPKKAKTEGVVCRDPHCGRKIRWMAKTFDQRLYDLLYEIMEYSNFNSTAWEGRDVFKGDHHKIADFQKLHYWDFIEKVQKKGRLWKITPRALDFIRGEMQIPYRVWVFDNEVVETDTEMTHIGNVEPRWQKSRPDWALDYRTVPKLNI